MTLEDLYEDLLPIVSEVGAQVDVPLESETFFKEKVEAFRGTREECITHMRKNLHAWFPAVGSGPSWIQEAEWQFDHGRPMAFIGQLDLPAGTTCLHDDASVFVFMSIETGEVKTVTQVA